MKSREFKDKLRSLIENSNLLSNVREKMPKPHLIITSKSFKRSDRIQNQLETLLSLYNRDHKRRKDSWSRSNDQLLGIRN